jgi:predicted transcriptional regulator
MTKKERTSTLPVIIRFLATNAPASKYEIAEKTGKSYSNIHRSMDVLKAQEFVEIAETKPSIKNKNMKVECYRLTHLGLINILPWLEIKEATMDKLTKNFGDVNLTFKYWPKIKDEDARKLIIEQIQNAFTQVELSIYLRLFPMEKHITKHEASDILRQFDRLVFLRFDLVQTEKEAENRSKLLLAIKGFPEIRAFVVNDLEFRLKHLNEWQGLLKTS